MKLVGIVEVHPKYNTAIIKHNHETYRARLEEFNLPDNRLCRAVDEVVDCKVSFNLVSGLSGLEPINISIIKRSKPRAEINGPNVVSKDKLRELLNKYN